MSRQCTLDRRPGPVGRALSAQAAHPTGLLGAALGALWVHETAALNDEVIAALAPHRGARVLDLGCGPGRAVDELRRRGARVTGVDASPAMVEAARRRNAAAIDAGEVEVLAGQADGIPASDDAFDAAMTVHTVYFWPDLDRGLVELRRVLAPGGRLVIGFRPRERGLPRRFDPQVYRGPSTDTLRAALQRVGFDDVRFADAASASLAIATAPS